MSSIDLSPRLVRKRQVSRMATIALASITYFVAAIAALHFLRSDINPIKQATSEYAVGPYGILMTSAFFSMSIASLALVAGLYQGLTPAARSKIGLGLLGLGAVGVLIAAAFPIDLQGAPQTIHGTIHQVNGPITFLSMSVGAIFVSLRFKQDKNWRTLHRPALILSLVMLLEFIGTGLAIATESGFGGLGQRVFLATFVTWFLVTAARLRSTPIEPVPD